MFLPRPASYGLIGAALAIGLAAHGCLQQEQTSAVHPTRAPTPAPTTPHASGYTDTHGTIMLRAGGLENSLQAVFCLGCHFLSKGATDTLVGPGATPDPLDCRTCHEVPGPDPHPEPSTYLFSHIEEVQKAGGAQRAVDVYGRPCGACHSLNCGEGGFPTVAPDGTGSCVPTQTMIKSRGASDSCIVCHPPL